MFDPETLMNTDIEEAGSTEYTPIPINDEGYPAIIKDVNLKEVVRQSDGEVFRFCEIPYELDDEKVREVTGMDHPRARQSILLDFTDSGTLDMGKGKNVQLNRLREACRQNKPGQKWNFNMLVGQAVRVMIKHRTADDGQVYSEVKTVTKL